jgi:LPXTG-motif cell wall-anchored protein
MPTITTTASPSVAIGGQLTDTAIVSGRVSPLAGATIDFRLYGPNDDTCTGAPVFESLGVPYPVAGGPVTSAAFTPTTQGVYRWRASYSGDANNAAVAGACNDANENVVVVPAPIVLPGSELPATGSQNGPLIAVGASLVLAGWFMVASSSGRPRRTRREPLG